MRKFLLCMIFLFAFIPISYVGFWYFAVWKTKNFLTSIVTNATNKDFRVIYDIAGFPSTFTFYMKNPEFSNTALTVTLDELIVRNKLLDKSLYIYVPHNTLTIKENTSKESTSYDINYISIATCNTHDKNHLVVKLNKLPFLSKLTKDDISMLRYEDYGLKCDILSPILSPKTKGKQVSIITEVDGNKGNYTQFNLKHKPNEHVKLGLDIYTYRLKGSKGSENYLNLDIKCDFESIRDISNSNNNFNIDRLLLQTNNLSLSANGRILNYNLLTGSFKDKINVEISNYTQLLALPLFKSAQDLDTVRELMLSLSERTVDDIIQFTIRHDETGSNFIGKLPFDDFIKQLSSLLINEDNR